MNKNLDREFDIFTGAIPVKEEVSEGFRREAEARAASFAKATSGRREFEWLRMLEQQHAARAA